MVLKFPGVENNMFDTSRASDEGIGSRKRNHHFGAVQGFHLTALIQEKIIKIVEGIIFV